MTTEAAQLQFAAEFTLFIAAVAAVAITVLRPTLLFRSVAARSSFVVGSVALAVAAFLHGSLLLEDPADPVLVLARAAGIVGARLGRQRPAPGQFLAVDECGVFKR